MSLKIRRILDLQKLSESGNTRIRTQSHQYLYSRLSTRKRDCASVS